MIEVLANLPDHVVGISAAGRVSADDYETVLTPAINSALSKHDRLRLLYLLKPEFTGFTPGAMWDDMKIGLVHLKAWEKIAVVTDLNWVANAARLFGFAMPCPVNLAKQRSGSQPNVVLKRTAANRPSVNSVR